jgi:hypothetical protein
MSGLLHFPTNIGWTKLRCAGQMASCLKLILPFNSSSANSWCTCVKPWCAKVTTYDYLYVTNKDILCTCTCINSSICRVLQIAASVSELQLHPRFPQAQQCTIPTVGQSFARILIILGGFSNLFNI